MLSLQNIFDTINMVDKQHLDIRTITMGISLLDCADEDMDRCCDKIYDKICSRAEKLVRTGCDIESEFGIPIVNKRISVTPIAIAGAACKSEDFVPLALTLDRAAKTCGVNFIGGYSALVQKGFTSGDRRLIASIPEALARTELVCSSVNVGSTRAGINMDAVAQMGRVIKETAHLTRQQDGLGCAKLVVFCNAVEDNPFMAGAFHGVGEADTVINVGVSDTVTTPCSSARDSPSTWWPKPSKRPPSRSPAWVRWWRPRPAAGWMCPSASWICRWLPPRRWATAWRAFWRRWVWPSAVPTAPPRRWRC